MPGRTPEVTETAGPARDGARSTFGALLCCPHEVSAQRQRAFPEDEEGDYVYTHSAVYAPIDMQMTGPGAWAASVNSLARATKTQWVEIGWVQASNAPPEPCIKPFVCAFSGWKLENGFEDSLVDWSHPYLNGQRPWFMVNTDNCQAYSTWHGRGAWHLLGLPQFATVGGFDEVINGLEISGINIGFTLGSGFDTNRWTENTNKKRRHEPCDIGGLNGWDYVGIDPNEIPATVDSLGGHAWRISVP